jgi:hypothetical protein
LATVFAAFMLNPNSLVLYVYVFCLYLYKDLDASGSRSETPGKFWNVVLEEDGKDHLD